MNYEQPVTGISTSSVPQFNPIFGGVLVLITVPAPEVSEAQRNLRTGLGLGTHREDLLHAVTKASIASQLDVSLFFAKTKLVGKVTPSVPFAMDIAVASGEDVGHDVFDAILPSQPGASDVYGVEELDLGDMGMGHGVVMRVGMLHPKAGVRDWLDLDAQVRADLTTVYKDSPWRGFITETDEEKSAAVMTDHLRAVGTMAAHFLADEIQGIEESIPAYCDYILRHDEPTIPTKTGRTGIAPMVLSTAPGLGFETFSGRDNTPAHRIGVLYRTKCGDCERDHHVGLMGIMLTDAATAVIEFDEEKFQVGDPVDALAQAVGSLPPFVFQVPADVNVVGWLLEQGWVPALMPRLRPKDEHMVNGFLQTVSGTRHLA
jgi:hypothetical protein